MNPPNKDSAPASKLIHNGLAHHQAGRLQEAEAIYKTILKEQPRHAGALHLLGVIAHQVGKHEMAVNLIDKAININPNVPDFYNNCGAAYRALHKNELAIGHYEQALALKPDYAEAHNNMGIALQGMGRQKDAITHYEQAFAIKPDYIEAHNNLGNVLNELGRQIEALARYEQALAIKPDYAEAHNNLGIALKELGRQEEAISHYEQAIAIKPDYTEAHYNLGNALQGLGRQQEAIVRYTQALAIQPDYAEAHNNLGLALQELGRRDEAIKCFEQALSIKPDFAMAYNNLGVTLKELGQQEEAIKCFEQALAIKPDFAMAHNNLGAAFKELGQHKEAIARYEQALAIEPDFAEAHNNLGNVFTELDREEEAINRYDQALSIKPDYADAHNNLGLTLQRSGKLNEAIFHHQESIRLQPMELKYRIAFTECLGNLQILQTNDSLKEDLITTLSFEGINHQALAFAGATIIKHSSYFQKLAAYVEHINSKISFHDLFNAGLDKMCSDLLLLTLLKKTIIMDDLIEPILTKTRSVLLDMAIESGFSEPIISKLVVFIYALSQQCFLNEYVYIITEQEKNKIKILLKIISANRANIDNCTKVLVAIFACYNPFYDLRSDELFSRLAELNNDNEFAELINQQVIEPEVERELKIKIQTIGIIDNNRSKKVRTQYEENPFPRWTSIHNRQSVSIRSVIKELFPHIHLDRIPDTKCPDILIAGCGTGQHAITTSLRFQTSNVLAVDISLSSLAYAIRKATELKITNIEFKQADLLNLHLLDKTFDIIECVGVLHHMEDPIKAWHVLANLLKPGALMKIGLYSEIARKHIVAAQAFIEEKGYTDNHEDICKSRQDIFAMTNNSAIKNVTRSFDFYTLSGIRDLLFHVHEKRFTLPQIAEIIDKLGLNFVGFEFNSPLERKKYLDQYPGDSTATSLHNWHKHEQKNTNTFISMYQFWVQKFP